MIDSHVHFYDPTRSNGIVWPEKDSGLPPSVLPNDFLDVAKDTGVKGVIAIETSRRFEDDVWLLRLAEQERLIVGVVLNLQPDQPEFERRYAIAKRSEYFCGIRLRPIIDYDLGSAVLRENIALLNENGHTIEFGAKSTKDKTTFAQLAGEFRQTHWILDHCGHPEVDTKSLDEEWLESMMGISQQPNAFVKLTDPFAFMPSPDSGSMGATCEHIMAALYSMFGDQKLVFGSNWPVCSLSANYKSVVDVLVNSLASEEQRGAVFSNNATSIYGL